MVERHMPREISSSTNPHFSLHFSYQNRLSLSRVNYTKPKCWFDNRNSSSYVCHFTWNPGTYFWGHLEMSVLSQLPQYAAILKFQQEFCRKISTFQCSHCKISLCDPKLLKHHLRIQHQDEVKTWVVDVHMIRMSWTTLLYHKKIYASVTERQWHGKSGLGFNQIDVLIAFFRQSTLSRHPRHRNSTIIGRKSELLLHQTFSRRSDQRQDRLLRLPLLTARMMLSAQRKLPRKQTRVCIVTIQYWSVTFRYQVV